MRLYSFSVVEKKEAVALVLGICVPTGYFVSLWKNMEIVRWHDSCTGTLLLRSRSLGSHNMRLYSFSVVEKEAVALVLGICVPTGYFVSLWKTMEIVRVSLSSGATLNIKFLGPVVESIISLTSALVAKMLIVLVSTLSNSQLFLLKKNVSCFCKCKSSSHFFSRNIRVYAIFNNQSFNDTLTKYIVSFEQLGLE